MDKFKVIIYDINRRRFEEYNILPYLRDRYEERKEKKYKPVPHTRDEFEQFIKEESQYQWWGRCEYEIILSDWPPSGVEEKWDVHRQVMMNLDVITDLFMMSLIA